MIEQTSSFLLVDDSTTARQLVKTALLGAGYTHIETASNGKEALALVTDRLAKNQMYHTIFLDWNMPEMDGLTFLKTCREELDLQDVAIIMLTAVSDQKNVLAALRSGANFYITKPVTPDMILKKLEQIGAWQDKQRKEA